MNKKEARVCRILQKTKENPFLSIAELAEDFGVSQMTIRRDLQYIEEKGMQPSPLTGLQAGPLTGASSSDSPIRSYPCTGEEIRCAQEKRRIAAFAVSLLSPGDVILLDSGTTAGMMPELIPDDLPLTVICYSSRLVPRLFEKPNVRLLLAGGYYHRDTGIFSSEEGIRFLRQLRAKKAFLSASGVQEKAGLTCTDQYAAELKKAAVSISLEKILLADSTKFGRVDPGFFAGIDDMDRIITDTGIAPEWAELLREKGIRLDVV